jgi:alpha/beta superfamily hydrolase
MAHGEMGQEPIAFTSAGLSLEGIFAAPQGTPVGAGLVICHPHPLYGGDMHNNVVRALAEAFIAAGYAVLRFNFRGVGRSTGSYDGGFGEQDDARAALSWLATQAAARVDRVVLAGYSFGARVALAVAATDPRLRGLIAVAPPILRAETPRPTSFRGPKIFISGEADPYAPPEALSLWLDGLPEPKRLVILRGADHFFLGQERALGQQAVTALHELS